MHRDGDGPTLGRAPRIEEVEMAVPKKRTSKQRKRKRRTHYKAEPVTVNTCSKCGDPKVPHRVCPTCGHYRDEPVIEVEVD